MRSKRLKSKKQRRFAPMKWPPCFGSAGRLRPDQVGVITGIRIRYCFGIFFVAVIEEYRWERAVTAGVFSLVMIIHSLFSPVSGWLIDRAGPRFLFSVGSIVLGIGLLLASNIQELWHLYLLFGVVIAVGVNTLAFPPHTTVIAKWFIKQRGFANGIVWAGLGVGSLILAPLVQFIIDNLGWREAFAILSILVLSVMLPLNYLIHNKKYTHNSISKKNSSAKLLPNQSNNYHLKKCFEQRPNYNIWQMILSTNFILMFTCHLFIGFCLNMIIVHQVIYLVDNGFTPIFAAATAGFVGLFSSAGGVLLGWLSDLFGRKRSLFIGNIATLFGVVSLMALATVTNHWFVYIYALLFGIGHGSIPPLQAALASDLFSGEYLGRIIALFSFAYGIGGACGSFIAGWLFDLNGNYSLGFTLSLLSMLVSTGSLFFLKNRVVGRFNNG